ncbi:MAG TPA: PDZ domain-containing protein [Vicinamibacterales bacterium]
MGPRITWRGGTSGAIGIVAAALFVASLSGQTPKKSPADAAFDAFWSALSPQRAGQLTEPILRSGITFSDAYDRLRRGPTYAAAKTGVVQLSRRNQDGVDHFYALNVPDTYDAARRYQVRIQLHGGVGGRASSAPVGNGSVGALAGAEQIYVIPYAWNAAPWWSDDQVENLTGIVDAVKRLYNVDENRVVVSGVSDGGTGVYYLAMHETTPFASFLPLNGYWMVLAMADIDDGRLFPNNLRNKPFFAVNGGRDPLYPTRVVDPYIAHMKQGGMSVDYHPQPTAGHNTAWWPEVKDTYEAFVRDHPRKPLPDTLTWEASDSGIHNRAHWLIVDKVAGRPAGAGDKALADLNDMPEPPAADFGARSSGTRINRVMPGSNAEKIGLQAGDVLMHVNDATIPSSVDVSEALEDVKPGSKLELLVARNNLPVELTGIYDPPIAPSPPRHLFARGVPSGRVDLTRSGNTVEAVTRGVKAFTLLLSPDQFDFSKPLKVIANGRTVFEGKIEKDLKTLLKYAAADNDRTMLFGAELHITLD